jgi:hypothetical protein
MLYLRHNETRRVIPRHMRFSLSRDDRRHAWRDRGVALLVG